MDDVITFDDILRMAYTQRALNFVPGSEYPYSNTGYNLLAEMVMRVTGQSFRRWTEERIFRPLGMADTHFRDDHTEVIPHRAFGYERTAGGSFRRTPDNLVALGSSSLFSNVEDLARWVVNFDDGTVGGREAMALSRTRGVLNDGTTIPYAFGISHGDHRGLATLSHSDSWASFGPTCCTFPTGASAGEDDFPMTPRSATEFQVEAYGAPIAFVRDEDGRVTAFDYRGRRAPRVGGAEEAPAPADLAELLGDYVSDELQTSYRVEIEDGGLVLRHHRHGTIRPTQAWTDDWVGSLWFIGSVQFQRDAGGRVVGLLVNAGERNRDLRFIRRR